MLWKHPSQTQEAKPAAVSANSPILFKEKTQQLFTLQKAKGQAREFGTWAPCMCCMLKGGECDMSDFSHTPFWC